MRNGANRLRNILQSVSSDSEEDEAAGGDDKFLDDDKHFEEQSVNNNSLKISLNPSTIFGSTNSPKTGCCLMCEGALELRTHKVIATVYLAKGICA